MVDPSAAPDSADDAAGLAVLYRSAEGRPLLDRRAPGSVLEHQRLPHRIAIFDGLHPDRITGIAESKHRGHVDCGIAVGDRCQAAVPTRLQFPFFLLVVVGELDGDSAE